MDAATGRFWVEDYQRSPDQPTGWTAFGSDGVAVGRMILPARPAGAIFDVITFRNDQVIERRSDSDGAAHITVYRLILVNRGGVETGP